MTVPFRPLDERVFRAISNLRYERLDERRYEVRVHPYELASAMIDARRQYGSAFGSAVADRTVFGLPIVSDPTLRRGAIVLRHEVQA